jgi:hypothetical protein
MSSVLLVRLVSVCRATAPSTSATPRICFPSRAGAILAGMIHLSGRENFTTKVIFVSFSFLLLACCSLCRRYGSDCNKSSVLIGMVVTLISLLLGAAILGSVFHFKRKAKTAE